MLRIQRLVRSRRCSEDIADGTFDIYVQKRRALLRRSHGLEVQPPLHFLCAGYCCGSVKRKRRMNFLNVD